MFLGAKQSPSIERVSTSLRDKLYSYFHHRYIIACFSLTKVL